MFYGEGRERQQHLADHFVETGSRVMWINPMGSLDYPWTRLAGKVLRYLTRKRQASTGAPPGLVIKTVLFVPGLRNPFLQKLNARLVQWQVLRSFQRHFGCNPDLVWTYYGSALLTLLLPGLKESTGLQVVYDNVQRLRGESVYQAEQLRHEADLVRISDTVICDSIVIQEDMFQEYGVVSHRVPQGVNPEDFVITAADEDGLRRVRAEFQAFQRPVLGYIGGLHHSLDLDLVLRVAQACPEASVVLVGPATVDLAVLARENVHILGVRPYVDLKLYIACFDLCMIPYKVNSFTLGVYPTKMLEYLAMKKPVVSTALPDVALLEGRVGIARDADEFVKMVRGIALEPITDSFIRENSWATRFEAIDGIIRELAR